VPGPAGIELAALHARDLGVIGYAEAMTFQDSLVEARLRDEIPDTLLLLEHPPVITLGRRGSLSDVYVSEEQLRRRGIALERTSRGGLVTYHGPGQLVGYPIIRLPDPVDVVAYVRRMEGILIDVCTEIGVPNATRVAGRSGVWVPGDESGPDRKVGAIGARVARGVTMHGFALNADCDLSWYDRIVPCGIRDAGTTTLTAETGRRISVAQVTPVMKRHLADVLGYGAWRHVYDPEALVA